MSTIPTGRYELDPVNSSVQFSTRFVAARVRGTLGGLSGTLEIADDVTKSRVDAQIDVASVSTGNAARDEHLRTADYFDVANHPAATFSTIAVDEDGDRLVLSGELTIRGTTLPVELVARFTGDGEDHTGAFRVGFVAEARISRGAFGVNGNVAQAGGPLLIGDLTDLSFEIQATRAS